MTDVQKIYEQYFHDVYLFMLSLSRDEHIAEEITQETFFKAVKSIDSYNGTSKISVWLCQIAKNTYFSYLKKQKSVEHHSAIPSTDSMHSLENNMANKEEALRIHMILHQLDEPYKEVFTLRMFGELSFQHISQIFGRTESWARVTFHRAKKKIQTMYEEEQR